MKCTCLKSVSWKFDCLCNILLCTVDCTPPPPIHPRITSGMQLYHVKNCSSLRFELCLYVYHLPSVPLSELFSIRSYLQVLESCSYCYSLHTLGVVNSYITMRNFHFIWCLCKPIYNPHNHSMDERSIFPMV